MNGLGHGSENPRARTRRRRERRDHFIERVAPVVVSPRDEKTVIETVDEWELRAPPANKEHWKDGRSAKETARLWCESGRAVVPDAIERVLESHPLLQGATVVTVIPELKTGLRGESGPRNHDLGLFLLNADERIFIGVEAKTDEAFDAPLWRRVATAKRGLAKDPPTPTNQLARIRRLTTAIFGVSALDEADEVIPEFRNLPFQLLSALAGTLIEADERQADLAVLLVHAIRSTKLNLRKIATNEDGYRLLLRVLTGDSNLEPDEGRVYGPFQVPGGGGIPSAPLLLCFTTSAMLPPGLPAVGAPPS